MFNLIICLVLSMCLKICSIFQKLLFLSKYQKLTIFSVSKKDETKTKGNYFDEHSYNFYELN
jgi:hypothetical protein